MNLNRRGFLKTTFAAAVAAVVCPVSALAKAVQPKRSRQKRYWRGGVGDWENPDNWSPRGVPGPGDDVFVLGGIAKIRNSASCHSLTVGAATVCGEGECHIGHLVVRDEPETCFFWRPS